jgi:mannose-6-phosphate isomerase-like protein (cupin superfamily)
MPQGGTVRLHRHPYEEIILIQEGIATLTVGSATLAVRGGQIMIIPAEVPDKFMNMSEQRRKQIDM